MKKADYRKCQPDFDAVCAPKSSLEHTICALVSELIQTKDPSSVQSVVKGFRGSTILRAINWCIVEILALSKLSEMLLTTNSANWPKGLSLLRGNRYRKSEKYSRTQVSRPAAVDTSVVKRDRKLKEWQEGVDPYTTNDVEHAAEVIEAEEVHIRSELA